MVSFSRRAAKCTLSPNRNLTIATHWSFPTKGCSHSIFSLIGPLGSESQLSIVRSYSVLQMILRTLRNIPLFYYAKRGYLLCTTRAEAPVDDGELATAGAKAAPDFLTRAYSHFFTRVILDLFTSDLLDGF